MALYCDWCGQEMRGEGAGYSMKMEPFDGLSLDRRPSGATTIVAGLHFHKEPCRENFVSAAGELAFDHEPTPEEIDFEPSTTADTEPPEQTREDRYAERRRNAWLGLPWHERERVVLEALGDGRMTAREITYAAVESHGGEMSIYRADVDAVVRRLFQSGELDRQEGRWAQARFRYFRSRPSDEVKKLEQALGTDSEGAA